ncbi:MAG TPA: hypothetical protein VMP68_26280 [Candidatus Eisenbacteria bacterium]|nr:hypothetical protein [Candidatus Eisenbacteria bacterium]
MLNADEHIKRKLGKLDSPRRVRWLRQHISGYIINIAARVYFRLPFTVLGEELDPYLEAFTLSFNLAELYGFTDDERRLAFSTEWKRGVKLAEEMAETIEAAAARHIQLYRRRDNIMESLIRVKSKKPPQAPHLTADDLGQICERFQHRSGNVQS